MIKMEEEFLPSLPSTKGDLPPVNEMHALSLANHLVTLYTTKSITDVSIKCDDEIFDLHSPVLSHGSGYFRNAFADESTEINLEFSPSIKASIFRIIVDSLYTGTVDGLHANNVTAFFEASHHLDVKLATDACVEFMLKNLDIDNCFEYWLCARLCSNEKIRGESIGLIGRHLSDISDMPIFQNLASNTVIEILSDDKLQVPSEIEVYEAGMKWIKYDVDNRSDDLVSVLDTARLPLLPKQYLVNVVGKEDLIEENSLAMKKYSAALRKQLAGGPKGVKPRHNIVHGVRKGYEQMSKSIRMSMANRNVLVTEEEEEEKCQPLDLFKSCKGCCVPEEGEEGFGSPIMQGARRLGESVSTNVVPKIGEGLAGAGEGVKGAVAGTVAGIGSAYNAAVPKIGEGLVGAGEGVKGAVAGTVAGIGHHAPKFGEGLKGAVTGLGSSLRAIGERITDPENFHNHEKRQVGGFWLDVTEEINENGIETDVADEAIPEEAAEDVEAENVEEETNKEVTEETTEEAAEETNEEVVGDEIVNRFSEGDVLEKVPEEVQGEEDLSEGEANSFDMEGLSVGTAQPHTETQEVEEKDKQKQVDVAKEVDIEESEDVEEIDMQADSPHDDEDEDLGKENDESKIIDEDLIDLTADISKVESTEEDMRQDENGNVVFDV